MKYLEFKKTLIKKFRSEEEDCYIEEEMLYVNYMNRSCAIELDKLYNEVLKESSINIEVIYNNVMNTVKKIYNAAVAVINWDNCYPAIRTKEFYIEEDLFHKDLFLDLDLYLIEDIGNNMIRFVRNDEIDNEEECVKIAFRNLRAVDAYLVPIDGQQSMFFSKPKDGFSAARILTSQMQKQIEAILGEHYLMIITDDSGFVVAKNNVHNFRTLKKIMEDRDFECRISDKIYQCSKGMHYTFADKKDIFRIIK